MSEFAGSYIKIEISIILASVHSVASIMIEIRCQLAVYNSMHSIFAFSQVSKAGREVDKKIKSCQQFYDHPNFTLSELGIDFFSQPDSEFNETIMSTTCSGTS
jgi:hypothetical protein